VESTISSLIGAAERGDSAAADELFSSLLLRITQNGETGAGPTGTSSGQA